MQHRHQTTPHPTRPRHLLRRLAVGIGALAAFAPALGATTAEAARPSTTSAAVAQTAVQALSALDAWEATAEPEQYVAYVQARDAAALASASDLGLDPAALRDAWATADATNQRALLAAITQLGVPYRTNTSKEGVGFDCSGLTTYAWAKAGVELVRQSRSQINEAERIEREQAEAGDLVYYPGHISMYLGVGNAIVHSPNSGNHVELTFMSERRAGSVVFGDPTG